MEYQQEEHRSGCVQEFRRILNFGRTKLLATERTFGERSGFDLSAQPKVEPEQGSQSPTEILESGSPCEVGLESLSHTKLHSYVVHSFFSASPRPRVSVSVSTTRFERNCVSLVILNS